MTSGGNNYKDFPYNRLTKFRACRDIILVFYFYISLLSLESRLMKFKRKHTIIVWNDSFYCRWVCP